MVYLEASNPIENIHSGCRTNDASVRAWSGELVSNEYKKYILGSFFHRDVFSSIDLLFIVSFVPMIVDLITVVYCSIYNLEWP